MHCSHLGNRSLATTVSEGGQAKYPLWWLSVLRMTAAVEMVRGGGKVEEKR